jgi:WD40 repeat protein
MVMSVSLSGDGKWLATGAFDNTARLWDVATGKELRSFRGHIGAVCAVALSRDGKWLVTGSVDKTARLWDVATGKEVRAFQGHLKAVTATWLSGDSKWLVTASDDKTARLWDTATGEEVRAFEGHAECVNSVAVSGDGKWLATGSGDKTACLWEVASGKKTRVFRGATDAVSSVSLSSNGKWLVTGGGVDHTARLWEAATGKEVRAFRGHTAEIKAVALSGDGKWLVTGSDDKTARLWEAATGREVRVFRRHAKTAWVLSVCLSADGKFVVSSDGNTARMWEAATGKEIRAFGGHSSAVQSVSLSRDGKWLVTGSSDGTARLWESATGKEVRAFRVHGGPIYSVALCAAAKWLATSGGYDKTARLWEVASGREVRVFQGHSGSVNSVSLSADGKWLVTGSGDKTARLWEVATGREIRRFLGHDVGVFKVSLSADARWLVTGTIDKTAHLWEVATGKEIRAFRGNVNSLALSSDGKWLLTCSDKTARLWEVATGKQVRAFRGHAHWVLSVALSGDGTRLVTGSYDNTARLWDVASGEEIRVFDGHVSPIISVALSGDGKHLVTGSSDSSTRLWDVATGKELCRLVSFQDNAWAVVDPDGRFDASGGGDVEGLHWVVGMETIALAQLKERFYEPSLLAKYMGFNKEPLREVEPFRDVKLFPSVAADAPAPGVSKLTLTLTNRGGGLGKVQVFVNGRELLADARGPGLDPDAASAALAVDLSGAVVLPGQKNQVRIVTWNKEGSLPSRGLDLDWEPPGRKEAQPIALHAIVVGVSRYAAEGLNLRFAAKDATDMARALELGGKRLFTAEQVHVTLLSEGEPAGVLPPTRANLEKAFAAARKARPTDVLVVYLAGHGVALKDGGQDVYCYLTKEARTVSRDAFRDTALRRQYAVTSSELTEWFKKIPALKQVLILDTCAAGAAASKLIEHRDVSADQIRAIDRLRDRTGFHVLMGCAADRVSYEASQFSQGLLTYALLQGMRGAKLREGEYVDVMDLFQYAADQVPVLARNIGGIQKPLVFAPRGTSFDIGRLKKEDKEKIPLAQVRPLLLRPVLLNPDVGDDDLNLMPLLRQRLREQSFAGARGGQQPGAVYVDADEMPGAVRPSGTYTLTAGKVRVRLVLRRDGKTVASVQVDGGRDDLPAMVQRLTDGIAKNLKGP